MDEDFQSICNLVKTYFDLHQNSDLEKKVSVSLASMYIYYKRASMYADFSEASPLCIEQRLIKLFEMESTLIPPDCPELESNDEDLNLVLFQKINRYLFEELDCTLEKYLNAEIFDISDLVSLVILPNRLSQPFRHACDTIDNRYTLPVPAIEWTVNILEQFDYTNYQNLEIPVSLHEWIHSFLKEFYHPQCLIPYLKLGWEAIMKRYLELMKIYDNCSDHIVLLESFIDRLRNTMCYPARVSVLSSRLNL